MRLDKFLCEMNIGTRSQVKDYIKKGLVTVNDQTAKKPEVHVAPETDKIAFRGEVLTFQEFYYFMLNKPQGVVSATRDNHEKTVLDLLPIKRDDLFPVGRLDKDTEGLLIITNDGPLAHELLSPKKHVDKTYLVTIRDELTDEVKSKLEQGVDIGDEKPTMPARVEILNDNQIYLTIREGRFHQVKRMLQAVDNEVLALKRVSFGGIALDGSLKPGECRELSAEEVLILQTKQAAVKDAVKQKMMQNKDAVIFDLDGSLVDSMWIWRDIDIEYVGRFGIELPDNLQEELEGKSFSETADYFKERFPIPDSVEQIKADWNRMAWDKYLNEVPLKPGIPEFLDGCRRNGIKLGIATSNSRELVENIAKVHNLRDYFSCIMTACDVKKGKPAPDIYLAVAKKLGVEPGRCLVFEDIVPGIMAGKNAGMEVCAVEDAYSTHIKEQKEELADYYLEDFYGIF